MTPLKAIISTNRARSTPWRHRKALIKAVKRQILKLECVTTRVRFGKQRRQPTAKIARKMKDYPPMPNQEIQASTSCQICLDNFLKTKTERQEIRKSVKAHSTQPKRWMENRFKEEKKMPIWSSITSLPAQTTLLQATQEKAQLVVRALDQTHAQCKLMLASWMSLKLSKVKPTGWLQI